MALFSAPNVEVGRGYRKEAQVFPPSSFLQAGDGCIPSMKRGQVMSVGLLPHHGTI